MPGEFESWYFQGKFDDNSTETNYILVAKPWMDNNGGLQPYATIAVTTPDGTHLGGEAIVDASQFNAHAIH